MSLNQRLKQAVRRWQTGRYLRGLLREQEEIRRALERIADVLEGIGRVQAQAASTSWAGKVPRPRAASDERDRSSVEAASDHFFADVEAVIEDYQARFGRTPTDDEVIAVLLDHQQAREGTVEPV